jgi:hypothetical protein
VRQFDTLAREKLRVMSYQVNRSFPHDRLSKSAVLWTHTSGKFSTPHSLQAHTSCEWSKRPAALSGKLFTHNWLQARSSGNQGSCPISLRRLQGSHPYNVQFRHTPHWTRHRCSYIRGRMSYTNSFRLAPTLKRQHVQRLYRNTAETVDKLRFRHAPH